MLSFKELKDRALANLEGNWLDASIVTFFYYLIYSVLTNGVSMFVDGEEAKLAFALVSALVCIPLSWGFIVMFLDFIRGGKLRIGYLFDGYRDSWMRIFTTYLLVEIYTFLWMLLLVVPGIIKALSYSQTFFIMKDNPELSNNAAIEQSMRMMEGHKMELFMLYLSFIGWGILAILTFGIGFLFLVPYVYTTMAHFYEQLKAEGNG